MPHWTDERGSPEIPSLTERRCWAEADMTIDYRPWPRPFLHLAPASFWNVSFKETWVKSDALEPQCHSQRGREIPVSRYLPSKQSQFGPQRLYVASVSQCCPQ